MDTPTTSTSDINSTRPKTSWKICDEQAFVFDSESNFELGDYLQAMKKSVGGSKNIKVASKIDKNRIQVHLKSKKILDEFFNSTGGRFEIESRVIQCRRVGLLKTKILLSHVNPSIPEKVLVKYIKGNLKLRIYKNRITRVPLDAKRGEFDHVISWQRQFFTMSRNIEDNLPDTLVIDYRGQKHCIFSTIVDEFCRRTENGINRNKMTDQISKSDRFSFEEFPELVNRSISRENRELDAGSCIRKRPLFKNLLHLSEKRRKKSLSVRKSSESDSSKVIISEYSFYLDLLRKKNSRRRIENCSEIFTLIRHLASFELCNSEVLLLLLIDGS